MSLLPTLSFFLFICPSIPLTSAGIYAYDFWEWRSIQYATIPGDSYDETQRNFFDCNYTCATSTTCFSYSVPVEAETNYNSGDDTTPQECKLHSTRFGLDSSLEEHTLLSYYEKPIGYSSQDTLGTLITLYKTGSTSTNWPTTMKTYLSRYRDGIQWYVNTTADSTSKYEVIIKKTDIPTAEKCAAYCTRERGVIDDIGNRCISFNYHSTNKICHLLSFSYVSKDEHPIVSSSEWKYYERIIGDGCWITNPDCRGVDTSMQSQYTGTFLMSNINYEYLCLEQARYIHEDICDSYASLPTIAMYGSNGKGAFYAWNTWDLTTGCIIDLSAGGCPAYNDSRFSGVFRDSIGEIEFAAGDSKSLCFDRGKTWYDYCGWNNTVDEYMTLQFPDTSSTYYYPIPDCECDGYGSKYDITNNMHFCTVDYSSSTFCYRTKQEDYWYSKDILCTDFSTDNTGCQRIADTSSTSTQCYLYSPRVTQTTKFLCENDEEGIYCGFICNDYTIEWEYSPLDTKAYTLYSEISCDDFSGVCADFTEDDCVTMAETIHQKCSNDLEDVDQQVNTYYQPTGKLSVYPSWEDPYTTTLIRGIYIDTSYTITISEDTTIDVMPVRNGRWMAFTASNAKNMRQLDVWYYPSSTNNTLTLKLFQGYGVTDSIEVYETSTTISSTTTEGMIHFEFDPTPVMLLTSGQQYTWLITSSNIDDKGYLGYVRGNGYSLGVGDMAWDYIFVVWIEMEEEYDSPLQALVVIADSVRPWFELWFGMALGLLVLFCCFLCLLAWKRRRDEKKEKEEDRRFQAELKRRAQLAFEEERRRKEEQLAWEKESVTAVDDDEYGDGKEEEEGDEDEDDIDMNATDTEESDGYEDEEEVAGYGKGMDRVKSNSIQPKGMSSSPQISMDGQFGNTLGHAPLASTSVVLNHSDGDISVSGDGAGAGGGAGGGKKKRKKKKKPKSGSKKKRKKKSEGK